jgi:hypothetical protein
MPSRARAYGIPPLHPKGTAMAHPVHEPTGLPMTSPLTYILVGSGGVLLPVVAYFSYLFSFGPGFFVGTYLGLFVAVGLGLVGAVILLIGIVAAGVQLGMRS